MLLVILISTSNCQKNTSLECNFNKPIERQVQFKIIFTFDYSSIKKK